MRAILGLCVLGILFWAAVTWQKSLSEDLHRERSVVHGMDALATSAEGWSTLVIGRPSGAKPALVEESGWARAPVREGAPPPPAAQPSVVKYTVHSGDVLGKICQDYYGAERGPFKNLTQLVTAVAKYNGLTNPNGLGAGETLLLPDLALFEAR